MEAGIIMANPAWQYCEFCESPYPGCFHMSGQHRECKAGPRTDDAWVVGRAIYADLADRRGIKQELAACEIPIQVEIIEAIGKIAIKAVKGLK